MCQAKELGLLPVPSFSSILNLWVWHSTGMFELLADLLPFIQRFSIVLLLTVPMNIHSTFLSSKHVFQYPLLYFVFIYV